MRRDSSFCAKPGRYYIFTNGAPYVNHSSTLATFVNTLANSILGCFYTARTQRFASWVWPVVLRKLVNRWKWKGEAWFHYSKVLFAGVVGIAEMWFYSALSEK